VSGPAVAEAVICCKHVLHHRSYNTPEKICSLDVIYEIYHSSSHSIMWEVMAGNRRQASHGVEAS
jgi:hypothetical protein